MEEEKKKGISKKVILSLICGILIGVGGTTGFFKYQQSKNQGPGNQPPRGEISEDMIPEGMTKEEFEVEMKSGKGKPDNSDRTNKSQNTGESSTENEVAEE